MLLSVVTEHRSVSLPNPLEPFSSPVHPHLLLVPSKMRCNEMLEYEEQYGDRLDLSFQLQDD
jgi:hypothetical protein